MILKEVYAIDQIGFPILSMIVVLPLIAAIAIAVSGSKQTARNVALAASGLEIALTVLLWLSFDVSSSSVQFVEKVSIIPALGFSYHLGVDGLSLLFLPTTAMLTLLVVLYAEPATHDSQVPAYLAAVFAFETTMMGAFASLDLLLFWLFFVAEFIPSFILIVRWGTGPRRREAAAHYLTFMIAGSIFLLLGFGLVGSQRPGSFTLNYVELLASNMPIRAQILAFFLIGLGLAVKAPVFPLHTWMPKVLEQGPIVGMSVFLVGVKLGTYGFMRFLLPLLPDATREFAWIMLTLGILGMVYGALIALVQTNLRRLLAFASLSHMGVVIMGIFSLNFSGFQGAILQMLNLGIVGAGLFFIAGFLVTRVGTPDLSKLGGVSASAPIMAMAFLIIGLAGVGMPGTSGFNGEHLVMIGAFKIHWALALAVGAGTVLSASYFLWFYQRAFLAAGPGSSATIGDLRRGELVIAGVIGAIIFWIGLYTTPFLRTMEVTLLALEKRVEAKAAAPKVTSAQWTGVKQSGE